MRIKPSLKTMKKISAYVIGVALSVASGVPSVYAQGEADAIRYSRTELGGSARFRSMAGAFGALGGDFSAIGQNPAGLGIFALRKSRLPLISLPYPIGQLGRDQVRPSIKINCFLRVSVMSDHGAKPTKM